MNPVLASLLGVLLGGLLPYLTNIQIHKHDIKKLKLEHDKEVKVFTREKYEQLTINLYRLAYMVSEGLYRHSRSDCLTFTMEDFMMLMAEVETSTMIHFPLLKESYEKFSEQLIELYTELYAGDLEHCEVIKKDFDRVAENLLDTVKRYSDEYTKISNF